MPTVTDKSLQNSERIPEVGRTVAHLAELLLRILVLFAALERQALRLITFLVDSHVRDDDEGR